MSFCLMGDTKLSSKQRWEKVWQSLWCYLTTCSEHESSQWKFQDPKVEVPYHNSGEIPLHKIYISSSDFYVPEIFPENIGATMPIPGILTGRRKRSIVRLFWIQIEVSKCPGGGFFKSEAISSDVAFGNQVWRLKILFYGNIWKWYEMMEGW